LYYAASIVAQDLGFVFTNKISDSKPNNNLLHISLAPSFYQNGRSWVPNKKVGDYFLRIRFMNTRPNNLSVIYFSDCIAYLFYSFTFTRSIFSHHVYVFHWYIFVTNIDLENSDVETCLSQTCVRGSIASLTL